MIGTTWELKEERGSFVITVVRLNDKREKWICVVLYDSEDITTGGRYIEYEEPAITRFFKRIG